MTLKKGVMTSNTKLLSSIGNGKSNGQGNNKKNVDTHRHSEHENTKIKTEFATFFLHTPYP